MSRLFSAVPACLLLFLAGAASAAEPTGQRATVESLKGDAFIGEGKPPGRETAAREKDSFASTQYFRTAAGAFCELRWDSGALSRVGPSSVFRFSSDKNEFILDKGEGLFVFPKGKGGATISTPSFAAGILGTTVFISVDRNRVEYSCLEGKCSIGPHVLKPGEKLVIRGSQQAYSAPKTSFDAAKFLKESPLVSRFASPLPSLQLIRDALPKK